MLTAITEDLPFSSGDRVALMVNGLGGTPISELYLLYGQAHKRLAEQGISVGRSYVGEYCTSLDMAGASITLVKLDDEIESELEEALKGSVIGQNEAIIKLAKSIRRTRAGLKDPKRPIGSFIFLGPTGVGKTETARA